MTDVSIIIRRERKYIGGWELYRQIDPGTGTISLERETLHVMDDHTRVAIIDSNAIDSLVRYQYTNHLGTATLEVDDDTNIITYEEYYPYGSTAFTTTQNVMTTKRYRYIGMERDDESGFYYMGARYYCPWLARWLAPDPIDNEWYNSCKGVPQRNKERDFAELTCSSYEYCYANPLRFVDPNGEQATPENIMVNTLNTSPQDSAKVTHTPVPMTGVREKHDSLGYTGVPEEPTELKEVVITPNSSLKSLSNNNQHANTPTRQVNSGDRYDIYSTGSIRYTGGNHKSANYIYHGSNGGVTDLGTYPINSNGLISFPDAGVGFTRYGENDTRTGYGRGDHWINPRVAAGLFGVAAYRHSNNMDNIQVGDISGSTGMTPSSAHKSHKGGQNIDLRYIRTDHRNNPVNVNDRTFDWQANQQLVDQIHMFGFGGILSYPASSGKQLLNTNKHPGHADHMHLQGFRLRN